MTRTHSSTLFNLSEGAMPGSSSADFCCDHYKQLSVPALSLLQVGATPQLSTQRLCSSPRQPPYIATPLKLKAMPLGITATAGMFKPRVQNERETVVTGAVHEPDAI